MKIILISLIGLLINVELLGRINPFEPTDTYVQIQKQYHDNLNKKDTEPKVVEKAIIKKPIVKSIEKKIEKKQIVVKHIKILPFIKIDISEDTFVLHIRKKYKLINQEINPKKRKFIFDFKGRLTFYTKRHLFKNKAFKSVIVGTHKEKNFFRVVIALNDTVTKYKESVDNKNVIITIKKFK